MIKSGIPRPDTLLYFSYDANLLTFRMHKLCISAEFVSIARVDNYRLDFIKYSKFWGGPTATLVPTANAHVWGCIWRLKADEMKTLDKQEGVDTNRKYVKYIPVLTPYMGMLKCRVYIQKINPLPRGDNDEIPIERWPSRTYKHIMVLGAVEHGLPDHYIRFLDNLQDNGEEGCFKMACLLFRYTNDQLCVCTVPGRIARKPLKLDLKSIRESRNV